MSTIEIRLRWTRLRAIRTAIINYQREQSLACMFMVWWLDATYRRDYGTDSNYTSHRVTDWTRGLYV
jgi:hypothetical protein